MAAVRCASAIFCSGIGGMRSWAKAIAGTAKTNRTKAVVARRLRVREVGRKGPPHARQVFMGISLDVHQHYFFAACAVHGGGKAPPKEHTGEMPLVLDR